MAARTDSAICTEPMCLFFLRPLLPGPNFRELLKYKHVCLSPVPCLNQRRWDGQAYQACSFEYPENAQSHHASHSSAPQKKRGTHDKLPGLTCLYRSNKPKAFLMHLNLHTQMQQASVFFLQYFPTTLTTNESKFSQVCYLMHYYGIHQGRILTSFGNINL